MASALVGLPSFQLYGGSSLQTRFLHTPLKEDSVHTNGFQTAGHEPFTGGSWRVQLYVHLAH